MHSGHHFFTERIRVAEWRGCARFGSRCGGIFTYLFLCLALVFGFSATSLGQTFFGSIVGTVTDTSGAIIPNAKVTLINLGTTEKHVMETNLEGFYQFVNILPGQYRVEVEKDGFKRFARTPIRLEVQSVVRVDVSGMELGAVTQTVEVKAETPLLQPETSSLGQVVEQRKVNELPLNGRNPLALVALVPGVVPQGGSMGSTAGQNPFAAGNFQIGGGAANQSAAFWDGSPLNNVYNNNLAITPTQDSLQEFKVQTSNLSAEFGRFAGGVINLTTKSGTNEAHGALYEYLRNKVLNSNTFFNNAAGIGTPSFTQNQYGFSLSGPVSVPKVYNGRDRLFFFTNLERYSQRQGLSSVFTVPTVAETTGDFSKLRSANGSLIPIYDPTTTHPDPNRAGYYLRNPIPNNIIPPSQIDPAARFLAADHMFAAPNATGNPVTNINNWIGNVGSGADFTQWTTRIDANLGDKQVLFGRFTLWNQSLLPVDPFGTGAYAIRVVPQVWRNRQAVINENYTISPSTVANIRVGYLRQFINQEPQTRGYDLTQLGWPAALNNQVSFRTIPTVAIAGMTTFYAETGTVIISGVDDYSLAGSLTKIAGKHSLKFGGEFRLDRYNYVQDSAAGSTWSFDQNFTTLDPLHPSGGFGFASFMLGYPASGSDATVVPVSSQERFGAMYVQDDVHVSNKLTLNLGLRYELDGQFTERYNRESYFDFNAPSPLAQVTGLPLKGVIDLVNSQQHPGRTMLPMPLALVAPRAGLAYRVTKSTVIRTGYGIFYLPNNDTLYSDAHFESINNYSTPYLATIDGGLTPAGRFSNPFPSGILAPPQRSPNLQSLLYGLGIAAGLSSNPNPYVQQWNFNVQEQLPFGWLVDLAYAGSKGTHLPYGTYPMNTLSPQEMALGSALLQSVKNPFYGIVTNRSSTLAAATVTEGQLLRPYPQYTGLNVGGLNRGDSIYHSMQLKVEKRFGSGGSLLIAYTIAKLIGDVDNLTPWLEPTGGAIGPGGTVAGIQNPYNPSGDRALTAYDVPQRFVTSYVYDLPFGAGKSFLSNVHGLASKLVSGWGLDGVLTLQSGFPLILTTAQNLTNSFGGGSRPNSNGQNSDLSGSAVSRLGEWFNVADFSQPPSFTYGNVSRTLPNVRDDGLTNLDFALFKNTSFGPGEKMVIQIRAEVFNLLNHPQFGYPGMVYGTAQFGVVSSQANLPRLIQLAMRFTF